MNPPIEKHVWDDGHFFDLPEDPIVLDVIALEYLKPSPSTNVVLVSRQNTFNAILGLQSIDLETQTMVLFGDFATEMFEGDCIARVMIPYQETFYDIGYVISIVDGKDFQPFPGFEKPNQIRVASYDAPYDVLRYFERDQPIGVPNKPKKYDAGLLNSLFEENYKKLRELRPDNPQVKIVATKVNEDNDHLRILTLEYKNLVLYIDHCSKHSFDASSMIKSFQRAGVYAEESITRCDDSKTYDHCPPQKYWLDIFDKIIEKLNSFKGYCECPTHRFSVEHKLGGKKVEVDFHMHGQIQPLPTVQQWPTRLNEGVWPTKYHIKGINYSIDFDKGKGIN